MSIINLLINSLFVLAIFWLLAQFFKKRYQKKWARIMLYTAYVWLFLIFVSPLPSYLLYQLEYNFPPLDVSTLDKTQSYHIVVLGGGSSIAPDLAYHAQLSSTALSRLVEGISIYHQLPDAKLVLSGHSSSDRMSIAEMMAQSAVQLQINPADTLMITSPANTKEEAAHYAERFNSSNSVILVTSASHMKRAVKEFNNQAIQVIAAPTDYKIKIDPENKNFNFKPSIQKIGMMNTVMKEYAANFYIRNFDFLRKK